jgi:tRNA pseudouridine38-40 synthase
MARYKLVVEYHGCPFVGWQRQKNGVSVQQVIEEAIFKFSGENVITQVAGRTDAGVHATGQVCHFDLTKDTDVFTVCDAINFHVKPNPVSVLSAELVDDEFHARFSATKRLYLYRITNRRAPLAIEKGLSWQVPQQLNTQAMSTAAKILIGHHDFTTFRAVGCQANSPIKTLDHLSVEKDKEMVLVSAQARSFLYHQVRNIVGTLKLVGVEKWSVEDVTEALAAKDRSRGGPTAPACGLYLTKVVY